MLSQDWGYKASIGHYDFDDRKLDGWLDEFSIYDYALNDDQVFELIGKLRCSANKTTTEVSAFKYQGINLKRSLRDEAIDREMLARIKARKHKLSRTKVHYTW